ncbi:hypothetical protein BDY21DRAFT_336915 [Lineolata rhizophorae]|uniref:Uncharacterized protein n=1 Tax=Lineolata rhizophorae TaxID=578093 RepID=A0A6A6P7J4_9PEZI|nr:hypothetical protein BDY21DRAFT_336915 [Lineolata rhizophorae]
MASISISAAHGWSHEHRPACSSARRSPLQPYHVHHHVYCNALGRLWLEPMACLAVAAH